MLPSPDQLRQTYRGLKIEFIRDRIASGELSETALLIAREELGQRQVDEHIAPTNTPLSRNPEEFVLELLRNFLSEPFGWSWGMWLAVFVPSVFVMASFGTTARQHGDQVFLYAVICLQALACSGVIRTFAAVFHFNSVSGTLGKLVAIAALVFILLGLTVCSEFAKHGWGGG
jgi:hypothetical protein